MHVIPNVIALLQFLKWFWSARTHCFSLGCAHYHLTRFSELFHCYSTVISLLLPSIAGQTSPHKSTRCLNPRALGRHLFGIRYMTNTEQVQHIMWYIYIWVVWLRKMWNGDTLQENTRITIWANMHTCKHYNTWITSHVQLGIRTKPSRRTAHEMLVRHQAILARDVLHALHDLMWDTD